MTGNRSWTASTWVPRPSSWPDRVPPVPVLKPREVIAILAPLGFEEVRQRGSHKQFRHADGRATTVPVLEPTNPDFAPIELTADEEDSVAVVAQLIEVIGVTPPA